MSKYCYVVSETLKETSYDSPFQHEDIWDTDVCDSYVDALQRCTESYEEARVELDYNENYSNINAFVFKIMDCFSTDEEELEYYL